MKRNIKIIIALAIILLVSVGIVIGVTNHQSSEKIFIVATNFPAYDFARAVVGDHAKIKMLVSPGAEIHDFEPTPEDIIDIKNSQLFIYNGGESDEWVEELINNLEPEKTKLLRMMDAVNLVEEEAVEGMEAHEHEKHEEQPEYDEHIWTSLRNSIKIIDQIKNTLIKLSPENQKQFEENAEHYIDKLKTLDSKFQEIIDNSKRKTLIFGDRFPFRYFVDDYGLNYFAAFPGCSDQTEASSKTISFLIDKVKTKSIPVVFKIEMSNGNIAKTISEETGAKVLELNSAHNISTNDFKNGRTYLDIMEENLTALKEALE